MWQLLCAVGPVGWLCSENLSNAANPYWPKSGPELLREQLPSCTAYPRGYSIGHSTEPDSLFLSTITAGEVEQELAHGWQRHLGSVFEEIFKTIVAQLLTAAFYRMACRSIEAY